MKSLKWIVPAIAAIIFVMPALSFAQELRVGGEIWNRWTYQTGKSGDETITKKNSFALERGYFDLRPKFSESTSGRFTVDMFSTDGQKDGAGLKLKYGFIDFKDLIPIKDMTLTAGLQKVYFGTIYDWDYSLITKAPTDEYKVATSADYGITLNGQLPAGFGEYAVGVYNGEGYKAFGKNLNISPEFLANIRLIPIAGVTLGGSFMTNSVDQDTCVVDASKYQKQMLMDGMARLAYGPVDVWMEYIYKDVEYPNVADGSRDYTASGIMVMPILSLRSLIGSDIQLIGRYDRWDHTDNPKDKYLLNTITGGVNYNFMHDEKESPKMQLQLNLVQKTYDEDESAAGYANKKKDSTTMMMQLKYKFSNTIK
jgi:hypothetical protein